MRMISTRSHKNAKKYMEKPKKNMLQKKLKNNWIKYSRSALFFSGSSDSEIIEEDIPINIYNMVQTRGNIKGGGLRGGLFNVEYAAELPLKTADKDPTARGIRIKIMRALLFLIFIYTGSRNDFKYYMKNLRKI